MRRLPRISVGLGAGIVGAVVCSAVLALAATGTFSGSAKHAKGSARIAQLQADRLAARRAAKRAARDWPGQVQRPRAFHGKLPRGSYSRAVGIAERYLGEPYVWGGASPKQGFDSAGLVRYVYGKLGVSLPHYTVSQYNFPGTHPKRSELRPGDLVFFDGLGQVGIYIGDNEFIHAPHTGTVVSIDSLSGRYSHEYYAAKRILS